VCHWTPRVKGSVSGCVEPWPVGRREFMHVNACFCDISRGWPIFLLIWDREYDIPMFTSVLKSATALTAGVTDSEDFGKEIQSGCRTRFATCGS